MSHQKKPFELFDIVMMCIVGVASILAVPQIARHGLSQLFLTIVMGVTFFAPMALFCAELGSTFPRSGGLYIWIREAFGEKASLLSIWVYWLYNILWYPAVLLMIGQFVVSSLSTNLSANPYYAAMVAAAIYWAIYAINLRGAQALSYFTTLTGIVGILVPSFMLIILGIIWISSGNRVNTTLSWQAFFPSTKSIAGFLVIATILVQAFTLFFNQFNLPILGVLFSIFVSFGLIGAVSIWNATLPKYFIAAAEDGVIPPSFANTNEKGVSKRILTIQGVIVTCLLALSIWLKNSQLDYALITEITAQLAVIPYLFLFLAGLRLRYTHTELDRSFRPPHTIMWIAAILGIISCLVAFALGFFPKGELALLNRNIYQLYLAIGIVISCSVPLAYAQWKRP